MHNVLYAQLQDEFNQFANTFKEKEQAVLLDEKLITIQSKYNLQDVQPYFPQMTNKVISPDAKLLIESDEDFDPETDVLYDYKINLENKKASLKRQHYGDDIFYTTLFDYNDHFQRSATVYQNGEKTKPTHLCYLYLKEGLPYQYIECSEYGISLKTYSCEGERIKSYKLEWPNYDHHCIGELSYDAEGKLIRVVEIASDGRVRMLFEEGSKKSLETVLEELEEFLVENIADQILEKVKIEEPVYCLLFEYSMQEPFPPTLAFGITPEIEGRFENKELQQLYNAPDMHYFSERGEKGPIQLDFHPLPVQSLCLRTTAHTESIPWQDEEASKSWAQQVFDTYLRVCKRLMHFDFSVSFTKTEQFLVMARDFERCNEDLFYHELSEYKKGMGV